MVDAAETCCGYMAALREALRVRETTRTQLMHTHSKRNTHSDAHTFPDAVVLDLCSSWVSHLPKDKAYKEVGPV